MEPIRAIKGGFGLAFGALPLASLWLAFGGQFGRKDGIKNQRKFETKIRTKIIDNSSPGLRKSGPFLNQKNRSPGFVFGTVAPSRPRASPGVPKGVPGLPLGASWAPIGPPWDPPGLILASFLGLHNATICDLCSPPRRPRNMSHDN